MLIQIPFPQTAESDKTVRMYDAPLIQNAIAIRNISICREHYRLTLQMPEFRHAEPGQFVHICPADEPESVSTSIPQPLLRRAFSVTDLRRHSSICEIDLIYRVVGAATSWMESLCPNDTVSMMGPLGNEFPISDSKSHACLIAGGVGLPPLLWLADKLNRAGKHITACCGARSADLVPLTLDPSTPPDIDAKRAVASAREFNDFNTHVVISTDDGSIGKRGHIGQAVDEYFHANQPDPNDLVLYTCGPEIMMKWVADFAADKNIEAYACMEREMACGTGTCQSCVVPINEPKDDQGWRYALCCNEGPVYKTKNVLWNNPV
jgi:dihydroorotate dehydrogenase electron transfer subunit